MKKLVKFLSFLLIIFIINIYYFYQNEIKKHPVSNHHFQQITIQQDRSKQYNNNKRNIELNSNNENIFNNNLLNDYSNNFLAILLQPSPVATIEQLSRLNAIDVGWSNWQQFKYQKYTIYASITESKQLSNVNFNNIKIIPLDINQNQISALKNLIDSFFFISISKSSYKWIVFGNDHSFFIPPNLMCFLSNLDEEEAIYSGNKLQRGTYLDSKLYFASGGSGAVLSHVSIKYLIISWIIIKNSQIINKINKFDDISSCILDINNKEDLITLNSTSGDKFLCSMKNLLIYINKIGVKKIEEKLNNKLLLILSSKISLSIQYEFNKNEYQLIIEILNKKESITSKIPVNYNKLKNGCSSNSEWTMINPGIVAAFCLQEVFNVEFINSNDNYNKSHDDQFNQEIYPERFNIYGTVRSLTGEYDNWYVESKLNLSPGKLTLGGFISKPLLPMSDMVSFHYVSEMESLLLYRILSNKIKINIDELKSMWPKNNTEVGHYSRKIKTDEEANNVFNFLVKKIIIFKSKLECMKYNKNNQ